MSSKYSRARALPNPPKVCGATRPPRKTRSVNNAPFRAPTTWTVVITWPPANGSNVEGQTISVRCYPTTNPNQWLGLADASPGAQCQVALNVSPGPPTIISLTIQCFNGITNFQWGAATPAAHPASAPQARGLAPPSNFPATFPPATFFAAG